MTQKNKIETVFITEKADGKLEEVYKTTDNIFILETLNKDEYTIYSSHNQERGNREALENMFNIATFLYTLTDEEALQLKAQHLKFYDLMPLSKSIKINEYDSGGKLVKSKEVKEGLAVGNNTRNVLLQDMLLGKIVRDNVNLKPLDSLNHFMENTTVTTTKIEWLD